MAPPEPPPVRRRDRVIGAMVVIVGVIVAGLSVIALIDATNGQGSDVGRGVVLPSDSAANSPTSETTDSPAPSASGSTGSTATTSPPSTATTSSSGAANRLPLIVLNNTNQTGLAQTAAATFTQGGWTVTSTSNFSGDILSTCAYFDPNVTGSKAAATALMQQFPAIKRTKEKFADLPSGPVVVVLTTDYTAQ